MNITPPVSVSRIGAAFAGLILVLLLNASGPAATAAPVTSKQAAAAVTGWLSLDPAPLGETLGKSVQSVDTFNDTSSNAVYYIVHLKPSGFVIVAADDLVEPIAGFARAGRFDPSPDNPLGALVNDDLPARVANARRTGLASSEPNARRARAKWQRLYNRDSGPSPDGPSPDGIVSVSDVRIAPFTQTTWDQQTAAAAGSTACYNYYTPPYGAGNVTNYPAGCVATVMAQVMRYYQFPTTSVGTAGFTIQSDSSPLTYYLQGGNGSGGAYVWSNMPLNPPATPTATQCQAIGALLADAGATVNMEYAASSSSSILLDAKTALTGTFHFANAIQGWNNNADIGAGLVGMINPNLDARYPVLLGIQGSSGGHAVVADGYGYSASTLYHHLNLGWSGTATAWYALPLIDTGIYTFTVVDQCVYNAYTNGSGEIISGRVLDQISRPVTNATVTATGSGGPYVTTTDTNGIYALARIRSATSYAITITKANYTTVSGNFSTGTSSDNGATSGDYWGANFTMPMLTTVLDHLAWGAVASPQSPNVPFGVTIMAQNLTNGPATGFAGPVAVSAYMTGLVATTSTIIGNLTSLSYYYGPELTLGYAFTPNTNVQVTAVRGYSTDKVSIWTDSGTLLTSQAVSASGSWVEASLTTPITLIGGTTYRIASHVPVGMHGYYLPSSWPTTFANGTVGQNFYLSTGDVFPNSIQATGQGPLVDLRYQVVFSNSIPVTPTSSGAFANGVWNGNIAVAQAATNVVLKADDGAGHTALSTAFNVTTALRLLSPQRLAGGQFQLTVSSAPGLHLQILASSNLVSWATNATLTNTTGTTNYTDTTTGLSRRFYRAQQSP